MIICHSFEASPLKCYGHNTELLLHRLSFGFHLFEKSQYNYLLAIVYILCLRSILRVSPGVLLEINLIPLVNDLSPANRDVTVIEMTKTLAANEGGAGRAVLITRMLSKGVHVLTEAKVTEITEDAISYEKDGEVHTIADADTLVLAMGYRPNTKLADDLAAAGVAIHVLGDAQKCGNIRDAIGDGYKVACEL